MAGALAVSEDTVSELSSSKRQPVALEEASVLVVEDKVDGFVAIHKLLAFAGVRHAEWKPSGSGVVQFADTLPHLDLILLDLGLPLEDGYEVLRHMRAVERFKDTLIVAVTGHTTVEEMRKAQSAGFDGFLGKPLDLERFPGQLARILKGEPVWENN
jgi:two-component system cell cycle response regulator DivK